MANREKTKIVSRKHLARQEREQLQTRYILIISGIILAVVVILIAVGIVEAFVLTPNKPVATVNGVTITTNDFQARVRYERMQLVNQYANYAQFMQSFGDESTASLFQSSLQEIAYQLEPSLMGQTVVDMMVDDVLIQQEAEKQSIEIPDTELDKVIAELFGYYANGTPTPLPTWESLPTSTLSPLQQTLIPQTPTPLPTEEIIPTNELTPTVEAEAVPTAIPPTPTAYSQEQYQQDYASAIDSLKLNIQVNESEFRAILESQYYRQKVYEALTADIPTEEDQVWAHHILFDSQEAAQAALDRIQAGEDFYTVAQELSSAEDNTVRYENMGWFPKGQVATEFEEAAFALEIGTISEPVQTSFGWHLIQVLGHETRPIESERHTQLRQQAFDEWLTTTRAAADIVIFEDWGNNVPTEPEIPAELLSLLGQ